MTETRSERAQRLAHAANRARRNLSLRADGLARSLVEQRDQLEASLHEPAYGLGRRLLATIDELAVVTAEADAAHEAWLASILPSPDDIEEVKR